MGLIIGLAGQTLAPEEASYLTRKSVVGVILFSRNFQSRAQITELIAAMRAIKNNLLVCVDQEGGRVQRFVPEFVKLPALAEIGALYGHNPNRARLACVLHARAMALDMLSIGIDLSFAPVADLQRGNLAIGNRAFSADPVICAELVSLYADTLQSCGMAATLKHFPGHGSVLEDTHFDLASDQRELTDIFRQDLLPFMAAIMAHAKAVMTAHVSYPQVDKHAAGYSKYWLKHILRAQMGFQGAIISDDVGMAGGANIGTIADRINRHYRAGCDLILVCSAEATAEAMSQSLGRPAKHRLLKPLRAQRVGLAKRRISSKQFTKDLVRLYALLAAEAS